MVLFTLRMTLLYVDDVKCGDVQYQT